MPSITGISAVDVAVVALVASIFWHLGSLLVARLTIRSSNDRMR